MVNNKFDKEKYASKITKRVTLKQYLDAMDVAEKFFKEKGINIPNKAFIREKVDNYFIKKGKLSLYDHSNIVSKNNELEEDKISLNKVKYAEKRINYIQQQADFVKMLNRNGISFDIFSKSNNKINKPKVGLLEQILDLPIIDNVKTNCGVFKDKIKKYIPENLDGLFGNRFAYR